MTLVEIVITVAILAMALGIVATGVGQVARVELRHGARFLVQHIRRTYDEAVITGKQQRLLFQLGKSTFRAESTGDTLRFDSRLGAFATVQQSSQALEKGERGAAKGDLAAFGLIVDPMLMAKGGGSDAGPPGLLGSLGRISSLAGPAGGGGFHETASLSLPAGVRLLSMWTSGLSDVVSEGEASLLFFPGGFTQQALLHLEDRDKRMMTIEVQGLTGRCRVIEGYVEIPK